MKSFLSVLCAGVFLSAVSGCSRAPAAGGDAAKKATEAAGQPAADPAETAAAAESSAEGQTATGTVVEVLNAGNYTYVRVKTEQGDLWATTAQFKVNMGERITVSLDMPMQNFHSQTLNRDFPLIYFVAGVDRADGSSSPPPMATGHATTPAQPAAAAVPTGPVDAAPGGLRVANIWATRKDLVGKTVTVRGRVVKFNGGILDRNWMHIQDGTGVEADRTNDLTVTTDAVANIGDIVTATGKIAIDRNLGSGYVYDVILEDAKVEPK